MFAVIGVGKFPVFISDSGKKVLGVFPRGLNLRFKQYVLGIAVSLKGYRGIAICIEKVNELNFKQRFVINDIVYHPALDIKEFVPFMIYVYPTHDVYVNPISRGQDILCTGIKIGTRKLLFLPLRVIKNLTIKEAGAIAKIIEMKDLTVPDYLNLIQDIGIEILASRDYPNGNKGLRVRDPQIRGNGTYCLLIDKQGDFLQTNQCVSPRSRMTVIEMIILLRSHGGSHVYDESGYSWIDF